jgi:hypothetical protein
MMRQVLRRGFKAIDLRTEAACRGPKSGGAGWPGEAGRGDSVAGIERRGGGDGADMSGPRVSGREERWWFGQKGVTHKRKRKPMNVP